MYLRKKLRSPKKTQKHENYFESRGYQRRWLAQPLPSKIKIIPQ
jgi:hypothetical protein